MKCESCGENEAKFHYTKIYNGKVENKHLCENCASNDYDFDFENDFSMNKLFSVLIDGPVKNFTHFDELKCEKCGQTYDEFSNGGKFGCGECYATFKNKLDPLIKGIHGHTHHKGKIPKHSSQDIILKREEDNIRIELEDAVKQERFERAAVLRDKLKNISGKLEDIKE